MEENEVQTTETVNEETAVSEATGAESVAPAAKSKINLKYIAVAGAVLLALILIIGGLGGKGYDKKAVKAAEDFFASNYYTREKSKLKDAEVEFKSKNKSGMKVDYIYIVTGKVKGGIEDGKLAAVTVSVIGDGKETNVLANGLQVFESKSERDEFVSMYKKMYK
ncbi:MAG: hypothetical protein IKH65_10110 [Clostridia bacterium]|nr:hypothetical protein [Clostridia bacterium]